MHQTPDEAMNANDEFSREQVRRSKGGLPDITDSLLNTQETLRISLISIHQTKTRYFVLAMAALLMFGNNYSFDNPQALQTQIMDDLQISNPQYNLLYTAFSLPNIFLTLAGGYMIDLVGVRYGILFFCSGVFIASFVVAMGGFLKVYMVMLVGRALFGICSENLVIAQSAIVSKWFKGSELSMAIGTIMTVPELGSAFNSLLSPIFYKVGGGLSLPLFISTAICAFSLICSIVLIFLDRKADLQEQELEAHQETHESHEKVSFDDIKHFSATFWILVIISMLTLGVYVPFLDDANDFFQKKYRFSSISAGRMLMTPYLISSIAFPLQNLQLVLVSPFIGRITDSVGKRRYLILATAGLFIIAHTLFGVLGPGKEHPNYCSIIPLLILGTAYASYSCVIIPCVQYIVEQRMMGTTFGILGMFESIALASFPIIASSIVTSSVNPQKGYSNVAFFFAGIASIVVLLGSTLFFLDQKGSVLLDFINPEKPTEEELQALKKHKTLKFHSEEGGEDQDEEEDDDEDEENVDEKDGEDEDEDEEGNNVNSAYKKLNLHQKKPLENELEMFSNSQEKRDRSDSL